jgi:hypothetical protein
VVLPSELTPSDPTTTAPTALPTISTPTAQPTTAAPTAQPTTSQNKLSELLSSLPSDATALGFSSQEELNGTIPTEIGEFTKLSEYCRDFGAIASIFGF